MTDAGHALADRAARLLADAEAAQDALLAQSATPRGVVRLAAPMSFGLSGVAPILPDFLERYPEVSVDLHLSDALVDVIGEGFDIALRIGELVDLSLRARRLAPMPSMLVASPTYLNRRGRPAHPADLANHDCFGYAYLRTRDTWHFTSEAGETVAVRPSGRLRANNGEAALPAVIAGLGIAAMPEFIVRLAVADGRLEPILPSVERLSRQPVSYNATERAAAGPGAGVGGFFNSAAIPNLKATSPVPSRLKASASLQVPPHRPPCAARQPPGIQRHRREAFGIAAGPRLQTSAQRCPRRR